MPTTRVVSIQSVSMLILIVSVLGGCGPHIDEFPVLTGDYVGQPVPGTEPELFAPGLVSTGCATRDVAITPDGDEFYFCQAIAGYRYSAIMVSRRVDGRWTPPEVAPFSRDPRWLHLEPALSPDGQKLFFLSNRPKTGEEEGDNDIWVVNRVADGWGEPYNLGQPINTDGAEFFPSLTQDGTLYFCRTAPDSRAHQLYRSRLVDGAYQEPERLPDTVNAGPSQFNAFVAPDESYLIFGAVGLPDNRGGADYVICFRNEDDTWTEPINLGDRINRPTGAQWSPYVTGDGKYFFFMSSRVSPADEASETMSYRRLRELATIPGNGGASIYWVKADFIAELRAGNEPAAATPAAETVAVPIPADPDFPLLSGPYLGQTPPGVEPELFAPGIVCTGQADRDLVVSPDGREIFFGLMFGRWVTIFHTELVDGRWTEPVVAPFAADPEYFAFEPALAYDGQTVYFLSTRPAPDQEPRPGWANQGIFFSRRTDQGWSEPEPASVTSTDNEYYPSLTRDGTLYYTSSSAGSFDASIWRARPDGNGGFAASEQLPEQVNCADASYNAFIAPDESYLIVCIQGHPDNLGRADYWVCFRSPDDNWSEAVNLGPTVNGPDENAGSAFVTADNAYLFFSSTRSDDAVNFPGGEMTWQRFQEVATQPGNSSLDIYWVEAGFIETLRPAGF